MNPYYSNPTLPFADGFSYKSGTLHCGEIPVERIIEGRPTPFYLYNIDAMVEKYQQYAAAFAALRHRTCYAVKANSNLELLRQLSAAGCGMDVNSAGELHRALKAGIPPQNITMTGVGKTDRDIRAALDAGILFMNAESQAECLRIHDHAAAIGVRANIVLRINPDVNAQTHPYIATGLAEHKFGLGIVEAREALRVVSEKEHIRVVGFGMHLGSQIFDISPYMEGMAKLIAFAKSAASDFGVEVAYLNIGGGMGVSYDDTRRAFPMQELAGALQGALVASDLKVEIVSEPGRYLVANAGVLVARLEYIKQNAGNTFYIIDAGMNDLIRPALYEAHHKALPLAIEEEAEPVVVDVVGPVCESGDLFLRKYAIPAMKPGGHLALFSAGAYGAVMGSRYNSRPLIEEAGLINGHIETLRRAETLDDMLRLER